MSVLLSTINGSSLVLEMNRPESMNAMSSELANSLLSAVLNAGKNEKIRAIIISGAGDKAFCAGTDLKERRHLNPDQKWEQSRSLFHLNEAIRNSSLPVIAAINGWCLGGGFELALYCDLRIATPESKFGWPEMTLGAYPGGGGAVMLPRIIGQAKAKELFFTARRIEAIEALPFGSPGLNGWTSSSRWGPIATTMSPGLAVLRGFSPWAFPHPASTPTSPSSGSKWRGGREARLESWLRLIGPFGLDGAPCWPVARAVVLSITVASHVTQPRFSPIGGYC